MHKDNYKPVNDYTKYKDVNCDNNNLKEKNRVVQEQNFCMLLNLSWH